MLALVAVALANADGRTGIHLSTLLNRRHDRRMVAAIFFAAFLINALVAAIAGSVANRLVGQGVVALLVAMLSATYYEIFIDAKCVISPIRE